MPIQIQLRRGSAAEWTSANPVLAAGEVGLELDTTKVKIGDGSLSWNSLSYFSSGSAGSSNYTASAGTSASLNNIPANLYALLNSPIFTGSATAPTATLGASTTQIANTAFVQGELAGTDRTTININQYPGYDSVNGIVAMSAWMKAYYDASNLRKTLLIPQKPGALGSLWNLTGGVVTSTTTVSASGSASITLNSNSTFMSTATLNNITVGSPTASQITWSTTSAHNFEVGQRIFVASGVVGGTNITNNFYTIISKPTTTSFVTSTTGESGVGSGTVTSASGSVRAFVITPCLVILDALSTPNAELATINNISSNGLTIEIASRSASSTLTGGKAHSGTYTVVRALPFLDNLKIRGLFSAGSEGQPVAVAVTNSSYGIECPYYWGGGSDYDVNGAEIEDIAHWAHQSNYDATTKRALFLDGSMKQLTDCRFNRCHFKHFTQIELVCSRVQLTNLYINNGYTVNRAGLNLVTTGEGYLELGGSDNVMRNVFIDASEYIPSDRSLVRCRWSDSVIDYLYITPVPSRPIEFSGYISGLQIPNLIINGLSTHVAFSGLAANRPSGASAILGMNYHSTDTDVVERYNSASTWVQITASTTLLPTQTNVATLTANFPPATTGLRRWALVSDTTLNSVARAFYSDGTRWRGPLRSSTGALQYLGADYGVWFNNVNGSIAIGNLHIRQAAQFDTDAGQAGAIRIENTDSSIATVLIANLQLEQSYGTDLNVVTSGRSNLIISNAVKDFTMAPSLTTTGSGNTILLYNFAANSASLGGIPAQQYVSSSTIASIGTVPTWTGTGWEPAARNRFRAGTLTYHDGSSTTTTSLTTNQLNIAPVVTGGNGIQALTLHENTLGVATASIRVLVYSDGSDGWPTNLVGSALFNAASAGQYTVSGLTIPGSPTGRHWIGMVANTISASARVWVNRIPGAALATTSASGVAPVTTGLRFQLPGPTPPSSLSASTATNATYVGVVAVQLS